LDGFLVSIDSFTPLKIDSTSLNSTGNFCGITYEDGKGTVDITLDHSSSSLSISIKGSLANIEGFAGFRDFNILIDQVIIFKFNKEINKIKKVPH
jgi:hypothetical protein